MRPFSSATARRHLVFVQYGDFREAVERFAGGGGETYVSQRYSVEHAESLTRRGPVSVVCIPAERHDVLLANGIRCIGLGGPSRRADLELLRTLQALQPTHVVLRTPHLMTLAWAVMRGVHVLPVFADSFREGRLRSRLVQGTMARLLSTRRVLFVANHNIPASLDLTRIGVTPNKVLPWDWPAARRPEEFTAKIREEPLRQMRIFYAGTVSEVKGVGDVIRAMNELARAGLDAHLTIAGAGEIEEMTALASQVGQRTRVTFAGRVPHREIVHMMREHDIVVVPSRHEYPEGLPMTIYEGLCSRTPLIASDHPMIQRALGTQAGVCFFRAGSPESLAREILAVAQDPPLYTELSLASAAAWHSIQVRLKYAQLIDDWLEASPASLARLGASSLAALEREPPPEVRRPQAPPRVQTRSAQATL